MAIALRNKQMLALIIIALVSLLIVSFVLLSVAHINIGEMVKTLTPQWGYGGL